MKSSPVGCGISLGQSKRNWYLRFAQIRDADERMFIFNIEITADGRDVVDGATPDQMVLTQ